MIGTSAKATLAILAVGGLLSAGLSACAPTPAPLACSATPSTPAPAPNTIETISIKTAPGAKILTVASLATAKPYRVARANGAGIAKVTYPVGTAAPGSPVKVTIGVSKNGLNGACVTTFVPKRVPSTPKPPLKAVISAQWLVPNPLPFGSGACAVAHPGHGDCGTVIMSALITGFSAYGGTPTCASADPFDCKSFDGAQLTGVLSLNWSISCPATGLTSTRNDVATNLSPEFSSYNYKITPVTRIDADSARVEVAGDFLFGDDVAGCTVSPTLETLSATNVTLRLEGGNYPTTNFTATGPFAPTS